MTVSDLGEHALLSRILDRLPRPGAHVLVGPGDDAAVLAQAANRRLVVTTDALIEDVHFSRAWSRPEDIGYKALAVNLSDLAAMGASPRWALVSLGLPGEFPVADTESMIDGLAGLARAHGVAVVGGNITRSPAGLVVDVTAGGDVAPRKWLTRSGARPGDELWLSGTIGGARAGLEMCRAGRADASAGTSPVTPRPTCVERYVRPEPRVRLGMAVASQRAARAAMDLSDGLADAVRQLAAASGCGARIEAEALPLDEDARRWWEVRGADPLRAAIEGGDDYELLLAVPPRWAGRLRHLRRQVATPVLTRIGVLTRRAGISLDRGKVQEPWPGGFEHFRS